MLGSSPSGPQYALRRPAPSRLRMALAFTRHSLFDTRYSDVRQRPDADPDTQSVRVPVGLGLGLRFWVFLYPKPYTLCPEPSGAGAPPSTRRRDPTKSFRDGADN